jgi:hypothetical protein
MGPDLAERMGDPQEGRDRQLKPRPATVATRLRAGVFGIVDTRKRAWEVEALIVLLRSLGLIDRAACASGRDPLGVTRRQPAPASPLALGRLGYVDIAPALALRMLRIACQDATAHPTLIGTAARPPERPAP